MASRISRVIGGIRRGIRRFRNRKTAENERPIYAPLLKHEEAELALTTVRVLDGLKRPNMADQTLAKLNRIMGELTRPECVRDALAKYALLVDKVKSISEKEEKVMVLSDRANKLRVSHSKTIGMLSRATAPADKREIRGLLKRIAGEIEETASEIGKVKRTSTREKNLLRQELDSIEI